MGQRIFAIFLALSGAFFLAFGVWIQSQTVKALNRASEQNDGSPVKMLRLLITPAWLGGGIFLGIAMACNVSALGLATLTVVQPLGAISLVITTVLNARFQKYTLDRNSLVAIILCVVGSIAFVLLAISVTHESPRADHEHKKILLIIMIAVNMLCLLAAVLFRKTLNAFCYIVGAGVLFGFVAVLTRITVIDLFEDFRSIFDLKSYSALTCVGLVVTAALGTWFVQRAYATGPPELVVAGLTVIDPIVGVFIGITLLGELKENVALPVAIVMAGAALAAISGVTILARHHPEVKQRLNG